MLEVYKITYYIWQAFINNRKFPVLIIVEKNIKEGNVLEQKKENNKGKNKKSCIYLALGISFGAASGILFHNIALGIAIGTAIGIALSIELNH